MDFMKTARFWVGLSLVVTVVGVVSLLTRGLNLSIDFLGGTLLDVRFERPVSIVEVRDALTTFDRAFGESQIRLDEKDPRSVLITAPAIDDARRPQLFAELEKKLGKFEARRVEKVGAQISSELTWQAIKALAIASVLQVIYVTWRFEFKFAVSAIIALLHDALITLGIFSVLGAEVSSSFVAAVLTVIGYSMNDTIVVFDRIRENLRMRRRGESLEDLTNRSIREVLRRSIRTGLAALFTLIAITLFGGETTRDFALAMFVGIVSGTYSSIFIASPLWLWWHQAAERARSRAPKAA